MTSMILTLPPASAEEGKLLRRKYASFPLSKEESLLKKKYDEGKRKPAPKEKTIKSAKETSTIPLKRSGSLDSEEIKRETIKKLQALGRVNSPATKQAIISEDATKETKDSTSKPVTEEPEENKLIPYNFIQGNTIYVTGRGISEMVLKKSFTEFGRILSINMEAEKNCAFITFDSYEATSRAINEMDNTTAGGVSLKVSYSRKQNFVYIPDKVATHSPWARAAAGQVEVPLLTLYLRLLYSVYPQTFSKMIAVNLIVIEKAL
ncbi:uncharacterized protein TRIADDRAFT_53276 [Trichoplax adhaerens]|uniref:Negative elongation factor E n=1 Tax=Trichoplax adhaerens TaxID=10228 RepID=B3RNT1_TRIAD|nr:hypothetical protein TRIADDRAFT_53276 [Trichoplax adhaerens]EDV27516.1 hypothetical protein TRIADDRAFT_53276 [Trichoplax adhaerens]|eukprot:XP_002109350.1 hypothetical protein TRIADDRAFT_53276 [Trichoplax adhaerens]